MQDYNEYTILLQNNASKEYFRYDKQTNLSNSHLYYKFDIVLEVPEGEYTYVVFPNNRGDVEYEYKNPVQDTILRVNGEEIVLKDLQPSIGLMRAGKEVKQDNIYDKGNDNNKIFYYDD